MWHAVYQLVVSGLVGYVIASHMLSELHVCPECRTKELEDVERHVLVFHPGLFWPRDPEDPEFGLDPRPDEPLSNVLGRIKLWGV